MDELIKITEQNGKQAVSARELHAFLESKQQFTDWIKNRIKKYGFVENQDYEVFHNFMINPDGGRPLDEYALSISCSKELAMVEGNAKGKQARQYFISCEEKVKNLSKPLSDAEMFLQNAKMMVEYERRINTIESKVDAILEKQHEAEMELKALPVSTEKVPEMSLSDNCRLLVNRYCSATGTYQKTVWDNVYQTLYYNFHIAIKNYQKINKNESWLQLAERKGFIEQVHIVISNLLKEKGIAA